MRRYEIPKEQRQWDRYDEFHRATGPIVYFETGELVLVEGAPSVDWRHTYSDYNVELMATGDHGVCPTLYTQDGKEIPNAWLYDSGQQYLLIDHDMRIAVRTDGVKRCWRDSTGALISHYGDQRRPQLLPGIPERFQAIAYAYIGGPQCAPVGCAQIVARAPVAKAGYSQEEREHMSMIVNTARAAMKLTGHEAADGERRERSFSSGVDPEMLLRCKTWQDVEPNYLRELFLYGIGRRKMCFDYLLTRQP